MRDLVLQVRNQLLETEDSLCFDRPRLVTEAYQRYEGEPVPLKRAKAFAHILRHMKLDVDSNPLFAGNMSIRPRAWMLIPEHGLVGDAQVELENSGLRGFLDGKIPADLKEYWAHRSYGGNSGAGHLAVDLWRVVHEGLDSLIAEAKRYAACGSSRERVYRRAMLITLEAVNAWARRYSREAVQAAARARDPLIKAAHERVARACLQVPARPARDLFEGLQAITLVHLAICIEGHGMSVSVGLPDRVLSPFIGLEFDADEATNLIAAFMLKLTANSFLGRGSKTQAITVGGRDWRGRDCCNELTSCFLRACDLLRVGDPHVFLRWHEDMDAGVRRQATEMLARGLSMPLLVNDTPTAQGFMSAGVKPEDAWEYCVIGCNELGIPGRAADTAISRHGTIQHLKLLNETLFEMADKDSIDGLSCVLSALEERMLEHARKGRERGEQARLRAAECVPAPFTSSLMRGCIAKGRDMLVGMQYHFPGLYERGLTNATNALAALEHCCFATTPSAVCHGPDEQQPSSGSSLEGDRAVGRQRPPLSLSIDEVINAMRQDFPDPQVQARLLAAPKWGNDDERADRWARRLVQMRERVLDRVDAEWGHQPHFVCHVVRSLHHLDGRQIGASCDGRKAWTPVCDSIGAASGTALSGPTAILNSVLKLDADRYYRGGYNLNLTLPPGDTTPDVLLALIEGFFSRGGQELQVNCFDVEMLRDAQRHPERYGDLVVRVAGLSARFVDLSPLEQEELIVRAESLG